MPEVATEDATLYCEIDGEGEPVTVFAHGLTNSRKESAQLTQFLPGTKVRFDFRGHGRSSVPETGYHFSDFARDLDAVASTHGATRAVGTSLGAGAICNLVARVPDRFERLILLFPAALDMPFEHKARFLQTAEILETKPKDEAIAEIMANPDRTEEYAQVPWLRELAEQMWEDVNPAGIACAIREVIEDFAVKDREMLRAVKAPTLIISRGGDPIHPIEVGEILAEVMPNAELASFADDEEIMQAIPALIARANELIS